MIENRLYLCMKGVSCYFEATEPFWLNINSRKLTINSPKLMNILSQLTTSQSVDHQSQSVDHLQSPKLYHQLQAVDQTVLQQQQQQRQEEVLHILSTILHSTRNSLSPSVSSELPSPPYVPIFRNHSPLSKWRRISEEEHQSSLFSLHPQVSPEPEKNNVYTAGWL